VADAGSRASPPTAEAVTNDFDRLLPFVLPAEQRQALLSAYAQPPRAYHHIGHVGEVLGHFAAVAQGPGWWRPREVAWAVLYHDAIYVPGRRDNETASARLALAHLQRWPPEIEIDRSSVIAMIELTARHGRLRRGDVEIASADSENTDDILHFLDCDMAILAAPEARFDAYDLEIAEEYRAVPRWLYRRKRREFFRKLLDSDRIYLSDFFHQRLEALARANLLRGLAAG
jgi:predicted metal-dependent HD superfamily phosphohydrolase